MAQKVLLKKSSVQNKVPYAPGLEFGELAVNYASGTGKAFLATKKYDGSMATFHEDDYNSEIYATKDSVSPIAADVAGIKSNYVTKAQLNTASGAAVNSAYTMAVNYINSAISGMSIGDYLTVDSATSVFNTFESRFGQFALSATVKNEISALTATLEDDEYVIAQALNDHENRINAIEEQTEGLDGNFLTVESAASVFSTLESNISAARNKAESAYTYASIISGSVYSKTETDSRIATAKNAAVTSAYTAAVASANSYTDGKVSTINSDLSKYNTRINLVSAATSAVTKDLADNYWTKTETGNKIASSSANAITSAFNLSVASANSYTDGKVSTINSDLGKYNTRINLVSAATSAVTKDLADNYWTKTETGNKIASSSANAITSAFGLSVASANSYTDSKVSTINSDLNKYNARINLVSAATSAVTKNLADNYWNKTDTGNKIAASSAAAITSAFNLSVASANSYTDSKVSTINSNLSTYNTRLNLVSAATSAVTKNLADNYWTKTETGNKIASSSANAITSAFNLSVASANSYTDSKVSTINSDLGKYNTRLNLVSAATSAVTKNLADNYWNKTDTGNKIAASSAAAVTAAFNLSVPSANSYTDGKISTVNSDIATLNNKVTAFSSSVKTLLTNIYTYKGSVANYASLPESGKVNGYVYNVVAANGTPGSENYTPAGTNYAWNGSAWDPLGGSIDLSNFATSASLETVKSDLSGFKSWMNTTSGSFATKTLLRDTSAATVAVAAGSARTYTNTVSGLIVTSLMSEISGVDDDVQENAAAISTIQNRLNAFALSATVNSMINDVNDTILDNETVTAAALTDLDSRIRSLSGSVGSDYATSEDIDTLNQSITNLSNKLSAVSGTVKNDYVTKDLLKTVSGNAVTTANAYTDAHISGFTSGNFLTVASAASIVSTLNQADTTLANKLSAVSGTVKNDYVTKDLLKTVSGNAVTAANAYTDAHISGFTSGNFLTVASAASIVSTLNQADTALANKLSAVSGTVKNDYVTKDLLKTVSGNAVTAANAYTDAHISGFTSGNFLTVASAASIVSTLNQADTALANKLSAVSGTVKNTYWTSATTKQKIDAAVTSAYTNAVAAASSYTKTVSGNIESTINSVKSDVTTLGNRITTVSAVVTSDYATKTEASTYAAAALGNSMAYTDSKIQDIGIGDYLTRASAGTMYNTLSQADTALGNKIDAVSGTVKNTYWTSATTKQKIDAAVTSAYTAAVTSANNYTNTLSGNVYNAIQTINSNLTGYVTTNTLQSISAAKVFSSAITLSNGYMATTAASFTNSYRTIPFASTTAVNHITYVNSNANSGLTYNPYTGKLRTGGFVITGKTAGDLLTADGGTMPASSFAASGVVATAQEGISTLNNKVNAITSGYAASAVVKTTYWTSATTKQKIDAAVTSAYTASTAVTKALSGNVVTAIATVNEGLSTANDRITAVSAIVTNNYATEAEASEFAAAALGNAMAYTDSKIQDIAIGDYLTRASAGTMYNTLNQKITTASGSLVSLSGSVVSNYWNSTTVQNKINEASAYTYTKAVSAANSYAKAISGTMESNFNTVNQKITATSGSLVSFSASVRTLLSTVYTYKGSVANYASLPATGKVEGYVYNVVAANGTPGQTGYTPAGTNYAWNGSAWDPLGGTVDMSWVASSAIVKSGFDTIDESITDSNNRIAAVSAVVTNNYATNARASSYAAAALSNAMDYTDSKIQDISIGDYLTRASAGTMYNTLNQAISTKATDTAVVHKAGDTMTGNLVFNVGANGYSDSYTSSGINMNNSNIVGVNSIYTKDASDNAQEGIHFYRDTTHVDTIWAASGKLNFTPNRQLTTNGTTYEVYHTGNLTTGNFATTAVTQTINSNIATLNNKVSAITSGYALSAVVKTTYWTSATTKQKIDDAVTSAYTASTAVTKALSGNVVNAIDVVNSNIRTLSGNVVNAISDNEEVISAAFNELHTEIENLESTVTSYSDSLDVLPNSYLTVASANSIVNTLNSNITTNSNKIEQLTANSGAMNTTLNKINGSYVSAVSFTTGATAASITNHTMTIPKPKVLTIQANGTNIATYDGMTAVTANVVTSTTDEKVKQEGVAYSSGTVLQTVRPVLLANIMGSLNPSQTSTAATTTTSKFSPYIWAIPEHGDLGAMTMTIGRENLGSVEDPGAVVLSYNKDTNSLDFIFS